MSITYVCDQCHGPIVDMFVTAATPTERGDFCSPICLSAWNTARVESKLAPKSDPEPEPTPEPVKPKPAAQDAKVRTCEVCGRIGTRRYVATATGWRCSPTATACAPRFQPKGAPSPVARARDAVAELVDGVADKVLNAPPPKPNASAIGIGGTSAFVRSPDRERSAAMERGKPPVTARCTGCKHTWNLTGRVLKMAVDTHEVRTGHVIDVIEDSDA